MAPGVAAVGEVVTEKKTGVGKEPQASWWSPTDGIKS